MTVTPSTTANGVLSDPNAATDGSSITNGVYTVSGSADAVTAAVDGLAFTPTVHEVAPGQSVTTAVNDAPTLTAPVLHEPVVEGQTSQNLYSQILANASDPDVGAKITIQSIDQSGTMGAVYLDPAHQLLTYTADGYNPANPTDSFTYAVANGSGPATTGTVDLTITPAASLPTQAGTAGNDTLTASSANTRLIGGYGNDTLNANAAGTLVFAGHGDDTIKVNAAKAVVYGGPGTNTITLGNTAQDSIVLQQGGADQISGYNLHNGDQLDLRQVLAEAQLNLGGDFSKLASYVQVTDSGSNATLSFNPSGVSSGPGSTLAVLQGVGANTSLATLINDGSLRIG